MITLQEVLAIHAMTIDRFGGSYGVRDRTLLESAINRPHATFNGLDLYPTAIDKAAATIESIVKNHPFSDGNKRTGYILMRLLLLQSDLDIRATEAEKYAFVIKIAAGKLMYDEISVWIERHSYTI